MEAKRVAPEGARQKVMNVSGGLLPVYFFLFIAVNGLFNFTAVWEVFVVSAIVSAAVALSVAFLPKFREHSVPSDPLSLSVLFWCLLVTVSIFWAVNTQTAFFALVGYAGSLFLYYAARAGVRAGNPKDFLQKIGCAGGLVSLISIEMASTGFFHSLMFTYAPSVFRITRHTAPFGLWVEGARMQSLMGLPNLYATFAALCFFLVLAASGGKKRKALDVIALTANGAGFFLAGSRGGLLSFAGAFLLLVLFAKKGERRRVAVANGAIVVWCALTALLLQRWMGTGSFAVWPALGLMAYAAYGLQKPLHILSDKIQAAKPKTLALWLGGAAALGAVFLILALNIRSAFPLYQPDARLSRTVSLAPGAYELTVEMDLWAGGEGANVTVDSLNPQQAASQTSSVLAARNVTEPVSAVPFTVPDDSIAVRVTLRPLGGADGKVSITGLTAGGAGKMTKIPLEYNLIPEAVISRLQGIWADQNIYQRFVYWQDGMRLFAQSPVAGLGGGAFETLGNSVSDYYYFTKHVHNHYIQTLLENGILGLAAVLASFAFAFILLWRNRRGSAFVPYLAAAAGMAAIHSLTEASMQNLLNINLLFLLLGVISGLYAREGVKKVGEFPKAALCVVCVACVALFGGRLFTQAGLRSVEQRDRAELFNFYRWAVVTDPLNAIQYKSACISHYLASGDAGAKDLAQRFIDDIEKNKNTPGDCYLAGRYYLQTGDAARAAPFLERYVALGRMDPEVWDAVLFQYTRFIRNGDEAGIEAVYASVARLKQLLAGVNQTALIPVEPDDGLLRVFYDV